MLGLMCEVVGITLVSFAWYGGFDRPEPTWAAIVAGLGVASLGAYFAWRPIIRRLAQTLQESRARG
jgi:hypothetical protein